MSEIIIGLRGLMRGNQHWGDFAKVLKQQNPNLQFVPLEMPGNGERWSEDSLTDPEDVVEDLRKQMQKNQKVTLVGISLGGMVALKWAELYPEEIKQVFIINSSLKQYSPFYHRLRPQNYFKILSLINQTEELREKGILRMTSSRNDFLPYPITPFKVINFFRQLILAMKIQIQKMRLKPIVIASAQDRLVSAECSKEIAYRYQTQILIHPTAGHDIPLDDPQWLAQQINGGLQ